MNLVLDSYNSKLPHYPLRYRFETVACNERGMGVEHNDFTLGVNERDVERMISDLKEKGLMMSYLELCNHPEERVKFEVGPVTFVAYLDDYGDYAGHVEILLNGVPYLTPLLDEYEAKIRNLDILVNNLRAALSDAQRAVEVMQREAMEKA